MRRALARSPRVTANSNDDFMWRSWTGEPLEAWAVRKQKPHKQKAQSMLDISVHVVSKYIQQRRCARDAPGGRRGRVQYAPEPQGAHPK